MKNMVKETPIEGKVIIAMMRNAEFERRYCFVKKEYIKVFPMNGIFALCIEGKFDGEHLLLVNSITLKEILDIVGYDGWMKADFKGGM